MLKLLALQSILASVAAGVPPDAGIPTAACVSAITDVPTIVGVFTDALIFTGAKLKYLNHTGGRICYRTTGVGYGMPPD